MAARLPVPILLIVFLAPLVVSRCVEFFRKDYQYFEELDAFYKIHTTTFDDNMWSSAFMSCENEGAKLFYPKAVEEWKVAKQLMESINKSTLYAIVGMSGFYVLNDFISKNGTPADIQINLTTDDLNCAKQCVLINMNTGDYITESCSKSIGRLRAYICKKVAPKMACPTVDPGYKYNKEARKCYKVNTKARTWPEAWRTCIMEGGSLAVISDSAQASALKNIVTSGTTHFVGFAKMNDIYYSVKGNLIDDEYELPWFGPDTERDGVCGTLYTPSNEMTQMPYGVLVPNPATTFYKHFADCNSTYPFICEMELMI